MIRIGIAYHPDYTKHETGGHPENKQRVARTIEYLKQSRINKDLLYITPNLASIEEIMLVHPKSYIESIEKACKTDRRYLDADTLISPDSFDVALLAVGGVISCVNSVMEGKVKTGFALVRPPGHHACKEKAMGFCIFNNISIGVRYAKKLYDLHRILIIDFDVHHGNGTQEIFYDDPEVLYFSLHQYPFYPGTGDKGQVGTGNGKGYTVNVPLLAGGGDLEYKEGFEQYLIPRAIKFNPELIFVSAGFDAYKGDPLGGMNLSIDGYRMIGRLICELASQTCEGKVISSLEGGYNLETLPILIEAYLDNFTSQNYG
ncbi:MAG: histone deacetylase [bacterium]|nr:histone deacetylase [bacterium]